MPSKTRPSATPGDAAPAPATASPGEDARSSFGSRYFVRILVATFVFSAAINILMLGVPLYSLQVFTRAIPSGNVDTLVMLTIITVMILCMIGLLEVVRSRVLTRTANALEVAWRRRLGAEALESAARGRPDTQPLGDLTEVRGALTRPTFGAVMDLPWTPLYVIGIWLIHPLLGGLMLGAMLILVALGWIGHLAGKEPAEDARLPAARAQRLFDALQSRAGTARAMRMAPAVLDAVSRDSLTTAALHGRAGERAAIVLAATKWVRYLLQVVVTGVGAWLVIDNHLSFGGMIATSMLVARGMAAVEQVAGSWTSMVKSLESWNRLAPVLKRLSREPERVAVNVGPERLTVENVLFVSPRDQKPILRAVSFAVEPGETVCIVGANRSGKSVLARLLAGAQVPSAGTLRLGGLAVASLNPKDPRTAIGFMPQQVDLLPGTIAENIARFLEAEPEEVAEAARRAGIHDWVESLAQGYETEVHDVHSPLSGAAVQLLGLARAGFGDPAMIVLDEPTAGLDEEGVAAVRQFLADARERGITTIVLSHQPTFFEQADKVFVLKNGMAMDVSPRRAEAAGNPAAVGHLHPVAGPRRAAPAAG
ncbi:type I secretion system permease/ATPase [Azospirillum halopraeferens]|uniref:type I secretion system permease/ATPase n=1 Tax=Azospirillum halopraeferens TaxID=34010 RepID=UPI001FDF98D1|nr:ATP-binding cassette domain-containing protein [Azospirillum halopraeferens]